MTNHHTFNRRVWRAATIAVALTARLVFGIIVLASGDWLPGSIIVAASIVWLAREIPEVRKLCSSGYPASPRKHKEAK